MSLFHLLLLLLPLLLCSMHVHGETRVFVHGASFLVDNERNAKVGVCVFQLLI